MTRQPLLRTTGALTVLVSLVAVTVPLAGSAGAAGAFTDTGDSQHAAAIEYLRDHGVTRGCNPPINDRFCPRRTLSRGEMAAFLARAFDLPAASAHHFGDSGGSTFERDINAVAQAGITRGCNPPSNDRFCPNLSVTRGQMAAFLNRALGLDSGDDRFVDVAGSVFEADINAVARVGITRGCNPPLNNRFCPSERLTREQMATFIERSMEIHITGTTTTTIVEAPKTCDVTISGPSAPTGDARVRPGQSIQSVIDSHGDGATIVIASGVHRVTGPISPRHRNHIVGEPGAVIDGGGVAEFAFGGPRNDVTIEGLEIRNFASKVTEGAVRTHQGSNRWTIRANEIHSNGGKGIHFGQGWRIVGNYIHHNEQLGIGGVGNDVVIERNEVAYNNHDLSINPFSNGGGTKFVRTRNLLVRNNCVHNNGGPGLWSDGHNIGTRYEANLVYDNHHAGIKHEVSCDAVIVGNTVRGNGFGNPHWVAGAGILVANSPNVTVRGNRVENNNDGIGGIQGERPSFEGRNCELRLKNLLVTGNKVIMSNGHTGIVTNHDGAVFSSWNNRFRSNDYEFANPGGRYFRWAGDNLTYSEWKRTGNL